MLLLLPLLLLPAAGRAATSAILPAPDGNAFTPIENAFPFGSSLPGRYQHVYAGSDFSEAGPLQITGISLRIAWVSEDRMPALFDAVIQDVDILLSTSAREPDQLDAVFANNVGPDETLVHHGLLSLGTIARGRPADPSVFRVTIGFQQPFVFDPSQGNLLIDVRDRTGTNLPFGNAIFFAGVDSETDGASRVYEGFEGADVESGRIDSMSVIMQFHYTVVPEPSSFGQLSAGLVALAWMRSRSRRLLALRRFAYRANSDG